MSSSLRLYLDCLSFIFGAAIGSFLNVCIYRMPRDESVVSPPSHCPHCNARICWYDNLPLVSYLVLRGRCRHCHAHFTARYFLVELLTAALFLAVWLRFGGWLAPIYWVLLAGLVASTFIDFEHYIIPNEITYGGVITGLVLSTIYPRLFHTSSHLRGLFGSFVGALAGGGLLFLVAEMGKLAFGRELKLPPETVVKITDQSLQIDDETLTWLDIFNRDSDRVRFHAASLKFADKTFADATVVISETHLEVNGERFELAGTGPIEATTELIVIPREAMGLGDAKLLAAIGAFLGWQATLFTVFISSMLGGVLSLLLVLIGKRDWQSRIPYGPYIALGATVWVFAGPAILHWYLNVLPAGR